MIVKLVSYTDKPLETISKVASNCYNSKPSLKIVDKCIESGHLSVLEFAQFHFHIEGISRACSHQLVRHRTGKFCQQSQRYVSLNKIDGFVIPYTIAGDDDAYVEFNKCMENIWNTYQELIKIGIPKEDARFILPNACTTNIDVSFDLRNLIHFMNERLCANAQWEIRKLANKMKKEIIKVCPELEKLLVPKCEKGKLNYCNEGSRCCGRHQVIENLI